MGWLGKATRHVSIETTITDYVDAAWATIFSYCLEEGFLAMDRTGRCQSDEIITGNKTIN